MKKIILLSFILLIHCFPSYGGPNGKGIICKYIKGDINLLTKRTYFQTNKDGKKIPSEVGYLFINNTVSFDFIERINDNIHWDRFYNRSGIFPPFRTTKDIIEWGNLNRYSKLDRKTLRLKTVVKTKVVSIRQCEVYSKEVYLKKMEKLMKKYQKQIDDTLIGNKI